MKKLINAILMLSASLNRIAALIEKQNNTPALPAASVRPNPTKSIYEKQIASINHTHTSNPGFRNVKINKSSDFENVYKQQNIKIPSDIESIAKEIYNALNNTGVNPKHHEKVRSDLAKKWPTLSRSLNNLERHFNNLPTNKSTSDFRIWKQEYNFKDIEKRDI